MSIAYKTARRIAVLVIGGTIALLGAIMMVAPGPGVAVTAVGLGILAIEFAWARRWLHNLRRGISGAARHARIRSRG